MKLRTSKRLLSIISLIILASMLLVGCAGNKTAEKPAENQMQYVKAEEVKKDIEGDGQYLLIDVRKAEDYEKGHIKGTVASDMDKANKEGDKEDGVAKMKATLKEATGSETGKDDTKVVLVCYSGKSYAQAATDALVSMGFNKDNIYTLEGGMKDWEAAGDEYKALIE